MNQKNKDLVRLSVLSLVLSFCTFSVNETKAYYSCSEYGSFAYSDGLGYCKCMSGYVWDTNIFGDKTCVSCSSKYGYGATSDYLTGSCKCRSGYVWGTGVLGDQQCVSGDQKCSDQYGYGASYDSLSGKCQCKSGYVWGTNVLGKDECVSEGQYCRDKYGYNSRFNSLTDKCECGYGYEFTLKSYGSGLECESCSSKYGLHSTYNSLTNKCECSNGYTLGENNKCVEKQNNVYFLLKELNTDSREAVIKSNYDYRNYKISYGIGCLSYTIDNYLNKNIVVNLGTDFSLDTWDKIVLQDDKQTCDIASKEYVSDNYTMRKGSVLSATDVAINMRQLIPEGALIKTKDNPDIYIVKYVGDKWFKRLILSPSVFKNYGHLRWENVMVKDQTVLNAYTTSSLVRAVGDSKVYRLYPQGDTGEKRKLKDNSVITKLGLDADSIYEINSYDRDSYITGADLD